MGVTGLQTAELEDQGLTGCPREERVDDVRIYDIGKGVALLREPMDVIPQGLVGLLLVALEVPGVPRADIRPLEVPDEDPFEVRPVTDAVMREEFKPHSNMFSHTNGEVLNDEVIIIHSSGSTGEPEVFEPNAWVRLPSVFGDVGGRPKTLWERCSPEAPVERPWPRALRARAPVVRPATTPRACFTASLNGLAGIRVGLGRMADLVITLGPMSVADVAMSVPVRIGLLV